MPVQKFSLSITDELMQELNARGASTDGTRSGTINKQIERYFDLLHRNQGRLNDMFTDGEKGLIVDALNGVLFMDGMGILFSPAEIIEAIPDLAEKWHVTPEALTHKLKQLTPLDCFTLVDCVERWWNRVSAGEFPGHAEVFRP